MYWKKFLFLFGVILVGSTFALNINGKIDSDWGNGYCYKINVENNEANPVSNWAVKINVGNTTFTSKRNGDFDCNAGICIITPPSWANPLQVGQKIEIGFCGNGSDRPKDLQLLNAQQTAEEDTAANETENETTTDNTTTTHENTTNNTVVDNSTEETTTTDNTTVNNETNTDFTIQAEGNVVASYPESQRPTYKAPDKILEINPWNIKYPADGYAKMYLASNGTVTYLQDLKNIKQINPGGYVLAYPEVYVGNKPWNGNYVDAGSKLPAKLDELKSLTVEASWKYEHPSDLSCNFAMEGWFTKDKFQSTGVGAGEVEMMIMWYRNIQGAAGSKVGEVTIPVELNGKTQNITFDVYKANIGWDFVTFIPHNYQDFKNASIKFDVLDFAKAAQKYIPQINDLYLEDWEFGTEYGTPSTTAAKLAWQITKFKVTGVENTESTIDNNTSNNTSAETTTTDSAATTTENTQDLSEVIDNLVNNNSTNTDLINKIKSLVMPQITFNTDELNKYYPLFVDFFNKAKNKVLSNPALITEDNYNYLNSFIYYTVQLFTDLDNQNYSAINGYIDVYKNIISKLKNL